MKVRYALSIHLEIEMFFFRFSLNQFDVKMNLSNHAINGSIRARIGENLVN